MRYFSKPLVTIALVLLVPYIFIMYVCTKRTQNEAILPGGITEVESFVDIDTDYETSGSFNSVYVTTFYPTTLFQDFILGNSDKSVSVNNSGASHYSFKELQAQGRISHDASVNYALITAYAKAKKEYSYINLDYYFGGVRIYGYTEGLSFKVDDVIEKINGISYSSEAEYKNAFNNQKIGDVFTINRDDKLINITLSEDYFYENGSIRYSFYQNLILNGETSIPSYTLKSSNSGGPSGGLLQTLSIFNQITERDYTGGKTIAGTGTINLDGTVGAIGGIEQKIYTAYMCDVDIFFVPEANYDDAYKTFLKLPSDNKMELVMVKTFDEAVDYLANN